MEHSHSLAIRMINNPEIAWKATLSYKLDGVEKTIPINAVAEVDQQVSENESFKCGKNAIMELFHYLLS